MYNAEMNVCSPLDDILKLVDVLLGRVQKRNQPARFGP